MVREAGSKHDKFKHSAKASQKGGTGKAGKGTWGDMDYINEAKAYEGTSGHNEESEEYEEYEPTYDYEVQIWNIPRGFHDEIEKTFQALTGFDSMSENRNRRVMFAYFDTVEHADASLKLNNTKFGKRYVGVRYSNNTADWLLEQEKKARGEVDEEEEGEVEDEEEVKQAEI